MSSYLLHIPGLCQTSQIAPITGARHHRIPKQLAVVFQPFPSPNLQLWGRQALNLSRIPHARVSVSSYTHSSHAPILSTEIPLLAQRRRILAAHPPFRSSPLNTGPPPAPQRQVVRVHICCVAPALVPRPQAVVSSLLHRP